MAEYAQNGLPSLKGFVAANIVDEAFAYLLWAENRANMEEYFDFRSKYLLDINIVLANVDVNIPLVNLRVKSSRG